MPGLVLVEGVPGSGKTTLARGVAAQLNRLGGDCICWLEEDREQPYFGSAFMRRRFEGDFDDLCIERWEMVVARAEASRLVLDGAAWQSTVRFMFELEYSDERIDQYWARFVETTAALAPTLVHLRPVDPRSFIESHTQAVRASVWDKIAGYVASTPVGASLASSGADVGVDFWVNYAALCDRLADQWPHPLVRLTPPGDWGTGVDRVLSATAEKDL